MTSQLFSQSRGRGPALVLLHGWGLNSGVWEPLLQHLAADFRVTCIDLPGFGRNADVHLADYSVSALAQMLEPCLPDNAIVLGWSMGGLVAQQLALRYPHKFAKLVVVASSPCFQQQQDWPGIQPQVLRMFEQQLERDFGKTLERFLAIQALGSVTAKKDIKLIRQCIEQYPQPHPNALRGGLSLLSTVDQRQQLATIKLPTLRIYGRLDSLVPQQAVAKIAQLQPHCHSEVIAHASHAPFISHAEEFAHLLRDFAAI